jgi:hypothetical protein
MISTSNVNLRAFLGMAQRYNFFRLRNNCQAYNIVSEKKTKGGKQGFLAFKYLLNN